MTWWAEMAQGTLQFERLFRFSLLPKGLFAHLVMKLCQTHINILALWRNGLLLRIEKGKKSEQCWGTIFSISISLFISFIGG
jgi:hypothetical protein